MPAARHKLRPHPGTAWGGGDSTQGQIETSPKRRCGRSNAAHLVYQPNLLKAVEDLYEQRGAEHSKPSRSKVLEGGGLQCRQRLRQRRAWLHCPSSPAGAAAGATEHIWLLQEMRAAAALLEVCWCSRLAHASRHLECSRQPSTGGCPKRCACPPALAVKLARRQPTGAGRQDGLHPGPTAGSTRHPR